VKRDVFAAYRGVGGHVRAELKPGRSQASMRT
jgi:hypothetical protein